MPEARCNRRTAWKWLALVCAAAPAFAQPCTVAGQITDTLQGKPVANVTVKLRNQSRDLLPVWDAYSGATDGEGRFRIANMPPGLYEVTFSRPGFVWPLDKKGESKPPASLGLKVGEQRTLNLQLTPAAVISGRTLDPDGDPERKVRVQLIRFDPIDKAEYHPKSTESDDRGEYRFFNVAPGAYYLKATSTTPLADVYSDEKFHGDRPQVVVPTYFPSGRDVASARELQLTAGEEVSQADIRLISDKLYTVRVKTNSNPLQGSRLGLYLQRLPYTNQQPIQTVGNNLFRVVAGSYRLKGLLVTDLDGSQRLDAYFRENLVVIDRDVEVEAPAFSYPFGVSGTVRSDSPLPFSLQGLNIQWNVDDRDPLRYSGLSMRVAADGSFSFSEMVPESYSLYVQHAGVYIKSIKLGDREVSGRHIELTGAAAMTILLGTDGGLIRGSVEDPAGEVSSGTTVMLYAGESLATTIATDVNGRFELKDIPPGDYRLYAWKDSDFYSDAGFARNFANQSVAITVAPNSKQTISLRTIVLK